MNDYYTHREFLINELEKLDYSKPIKCLEFGTGEGSGIIFKEFSGKYKNLLVHSFENDINWFKETANKYQSDNYIFNHINSWSDLLIDENFVDYYDLIFVDQTPWEARIETIKLMVNKANVIILHDYDYFNKNVCDDIYSVSKGSFFYDNFGSEFNFSCNYKQLPPTLIMYNKKLNI